METKHTKALIKARIAECKDPKTMRNLKSVQKKLELHEKAMAGDAEALMKLSLRSGVITRKQYQEFIEIRKKYGD